MNRELLNRFGALCVLMCVCIVMTVAEMQDK